ncbi:MAG TPA: MFS transporter [Chloroflexota bacterium]|nr:MFS transporter [Chloroflexota bacterium]
MSRPGRQPAATSEAPGVSPPPPAPPPRLWNRTFALACLVNFTTWLAAYVLFGTVTLYAVQLGVPETQVGWFPASASACGLVGQLAGGRLLLRYRRSALLRLAPFVLGAGALLALLVPAPPALLATCALFGIGYGLLQSTTVVLATEVAPPARRGQAIGLYGTFTTLAVLIAPPTGVALLQQLGGRAVFTLTLMLTLVTLGCGLLVREPPRRRLEAAGPAAHLPPLVYFAALALGGMTATWGTVLAFLPVYALTLGLHNPGLYFSVQGLGVLALRMASGGLSDRYGRLQVLVPAMALVTLSIWGLALHPPVPLLLLLALLYGVGYSAVHPTTMALADDVSPPATRGLALAVVGGAFSIGVGSGAIAMGYVLERSSYETTFLVAGCFPLLTTSLLLWRWRAYSRARAAG